MISSPAAVQYRMPEARGRIVRSAISLFSRKGYRGTKSRDIARLADVSEVTLYRYFEHKEDVFWSALEASFGDLKSRLDSIDAAWDGQNLAVVLPQIITLLADTAQFCPEIVRLVTIAILELGTGAKEICRGYLKPLYAPIFNYLSANVDFTLLGNPDPAVLTAAIIITVLIQPELAHLGNGNRTSALSDSKVVESYTTFWLRALAPAARA